MNLPTLFWYVSFQNSVPLVKNFLCGFRWISLKRDFTVSYVDCKCEFVVVVLEVYLDCILFFKNVTYTLPYVHSTVHSTVIVLTIYYFAKKKKK